MKKIAVITMGVRLNQEKGYTRFRYICEFLADAGYEVDLITTTQTDTFEGTEEALLRGWKRSKRMTINLV